MTTYPNWRYRLTLTTLSPLHIGVGKELMRDYDYVVHKGKTWVIHEQALAELALDRGDLDSMVAGRPAGELLRPQDYQIGSPLFRYVLDGEPRSQDRGSKVQVQMKDVFERPYIPGSSLKGALRTVLMVSLFKKKVGQWRSDDLGRDARSAAQPYEKKIFVAPYEERGQDPNHDILRALRVTDSSADDQRRLSLINVSVVKWGGDVGAPIELEAIPKEVSFSAELSLDGYLLAEGEPRRIAWDETVMKRMRQLPRAANGWVARRFEYEGQRKREGLWKAQFAELERRLDSVGEDEFLLQLGWGGGWESKTVGVELRQDAQQFADMVNRFRLLRRGTFRAGDRFPRSRRVQVGREDGRPRAELGWLHIKVEALS